MCLIKSFTWQLHSDCNGASDNQQESKGNHQVSREGIKIPTVSQLKKQKLFKILDLSRFRYFLRLLLDFINSMGISVGDAAVPKKKKNSKKFLILPFPSCNPRCLSFMIIIWHRSPDDAVFFSFVLYILSLYFLWVCTWNIDTVQCRNKWHVVGLWFAI